MPISFEPKGPVYIQDGTEIEFKRVTQADLNRFNLDNNPFKNRSKEEREEIYSLIREGKIDQIEYTPEENQISLKQMPMFCVQFVVDVRNLVDPNGAILDYKEFTEEMKLIFFDDLYFSSDDFRDFVSAVKSGTKKKFAEMAQD